MIDMMQVDNRQQSFGVGGEKKKRNQMQRTMKNKDKKQEAKQGADTGFLKPYYSWVIPELFSNFYVFF